MYMIFYIPTQYILCKSSNVCVCVCVCVCVTYMDAGTHLTCNQGGPAVSR